MYAYGPPKLTFLAVILLLLIPLQLQPLHQAAAQITRQHPQGMVTLQQQKHVRINGYLSDSNPATRSKLAIYSKAHHTTYYVMVTSATIFREQRKTISRQRLQHNLYVTATCIRHTDGTLEALSITIVHRRARTKKK